MREVGKYLRMARAFAAEQLPFFADALYAAKLVVTPACPSLAAVDAHFRVYFHPDMVQDLVRHTGLATGISQLAFVWLHECLHVVRQHGERAHELNAEGCRWNVAADLEINDGSWEGLSPPACFPPLTPDEFSLPPGRLAEYYYRNLPSALAPRGRGRPPQVLLDEGSGVHGQPRDWELPPRAEETPAVSPLEQAHVRQQVAEKLRGQKHQGNIPGGWLRWAEGMLRPTVNWKARLSRRVRGVLTTAMGNRVDYVLQRPHRRQHVYAPILRPSLSGRHRPSIACVVDTSGSMSEADLAMCLGEIRGVMSAWQVPITVIPCDSVPYEPIRVLSQSQLVQVSRSLRGGGGTDVAVAGVEAAMRLRPVPDAVIVLTDGWTTYPSSPLETLVIFGVIHAPDSQPHLPPMPPWKPRDVVLIPHVTGTGTR